MERNSGRTTNQITNAPVGAVYIWPVMASIHYAKALARYLNRSDLQIKHLNISTVVHGAVAVAQ